MRRRSKSEVKAAATPRNEYHGLYNIHTGLVLVGQQPEISALKNLRGVTAAECRVHVRDECHGFELFLVRLKLFDGYPYPLLKYGMQDPRGERRSRGTSWQTSTSTNDIATITVLLRPNVHAMLHVTHIVHWTRCSHLHQ